MCRKVKCEKHAETPDGGMRCFGSTTDRQQNQIKERKKIFSFLYFLFKIKNVNIQKAAQKVLSTSLSGDGAVPVVVLLFLFVVVFASCENFNSFVLCERNYNNANHNVTLSVNSVELFPFA